MCVCVWGGVTSRPVNGRLSRVVVSYHRHDDDDDHATILARTITGVPVSLPGQSSRVVYVFLHLLISVIPPYPPLLPTSTLDILL